MLDAIALRLRLRLESRESGRMYAGEDGKGNMNRDRSQGRRIIVTVSCK